MGLKKDKIYYTYEDVTIMPNVISPIEHRSECIPLDENGMLPLFTAPMNTVVDKDNFSLFENEMIHAILPRTEKLELRIEYSLKGRWAAYSMTEFESVFCDETSKLDESNGIKALIDIANGHMQKSYDLVRAAKNIYGDNITIMVGNIANPRTYEEYARVGADYIRIGIGSGCFTKDTIVKTNIGCKKISDVEVGDKVLTHEGKYEEVINTISYKNSNKLVKINGVKCTPNHKFYVINKEDKEKAKNNIGKYAFWLEAEKIDKTKHLLIKLV